MNIDKLIQRTAIAVFLLCVAGVAQSQTQPWDTNIATWVAPTTCSTGEPITACPVTGYRVERAPSTNGTYATIASAVTGLTYTHAGVTAGQHCYRIIAQSNAGDSVPSNVVCKTNVRPAGPPSPPTNLRVVETVVYNLRQSGRDVLLGSAVGSVPLATACGGYPVVESQPTVRAVARSNVHLREWVPEGAPLVAKCG